MANYKSSVTPYHENDVPPVAMSNLDIQTLKEEFKMAARRAVSAGYKIIEIHAAHGYLIHQFLSPLVNLREDDYGHSFENRIRILLEIIDAVKSELDDRQSLWVRLSATDWAEGGWDLEQTTSLVNLLKTKGVEVADISSGGAVAFQQIPVKLGYQVPFAQAIKNATQILTGTVGLITSARQAQDIIIQGDADIVLLGREFLRHPHLVYQWAKDLSINIDWAPQYNRAK